MALSGSPAKAIPAAMAAKFALPLYSHRKALSATVLRQERIAVFQDFDAFSAAAIFCVEWPDALLFQAHERAGAGAAPVND